MKSVDRTMLNKCRLLYLLAVVKSYLSFDTFPKNEIMSYTHEKRIADAVRFFMSDKNNTNVKKLRSRLYVTDRSHINASGER